MISPDTFVRIASNFNPMIMKESDRNFKSLFGVTPSICATLWVMLDPLHNIPGSLPCHLLWSLLLMKVYATEVILCGIVGGVDQKTFIKWSWVFIGALSYLESDMASINYNSNSYFS